jgi:hypothetical protein
MTEFSGCLSPSDLHALRRERDPTDAVQSIWDASYAMVPTVEQRAAWRKLSRQAWPTVAPRRVVACIGRRGWKTSKILAWTLLFELLCVDHDEHAAAGSRIYFLVVCPRLAQSREALRAVRAALDELSHQGVAYEIRDAAGTTEIVVKSPVSRVEKVIAIMSADAISVRGFAVAFAGFDEASFLGSDDWLAQTDRDLIVAVSAGMVQFPAAKMLFVSSPGAPQGEFHRMVERPPADTLVVRAASWVTNPRLTEAACWRMAGGDAAVFAQEFEASKFGYHNESFIDAASVRACIDTDKKRTGRGPRKSGDFIVALDVGQIVDASAIVCCSSFVAEIRPGEHVRHVVVEECIVLEEAADRVGNDHRNRHSGERRVQRRADPFRPLQRRERRAHSSGARLQGRKGRPSAHSPQAFPAMPDGANGPNAEMAVDSRFGRRPTTAPSPRSRSIGEAARIAQGNAAELGCAESGGKARRRRRRARALRRGRHHVDADGRRRRRRAVPARWAFLRPVRGRLGRAQRSMGSRAAERQRGPVRNPRVVAAFRSLREERDPSGHEHARDRTLATTTEENRNGVEAMVESLKLPSDYLPGEGGRDINLELLDAASKYSADAGPFSSLVRTCVDTLVSARTLAWVAADKHQHLSEHHMGADFSDEADAVEREAGGGLVGAAKRAEYVRAGTAKITVRARKEFADKATAIGEKCRASMADLKSQIDRSRLKLSYTEMAMGPTGESLAELIQLDRLGLEIQTRGVKVLYDLYASLSSSGDDDECKRLERASQKWIADLLATDPRKRLFEKSQGQTKQIRTDDELTKENAMCRALLSAFERAQGARTPPELLLAVQIFDDLLLPAFRGIVGMSSWDMPTTQWNSSLAGSGRLPDPLELLADWHVRNLPNGRPDEARLSPLVLDRRGGIGGPPAWSPLGNHVTSLGGRVRTPVSPLNQKPPQRVPIAARGGR